MAASANMSSTDRISELLSQAQHGSSQALGEVLQACRTYLVMIAETELDPALRPKGGASDLVQQTFLEAQQDFARFSGTTGAELRAWLRHILRNNLVNFARTYRGTAKRDIRREIHLEAGRSSCDLRATLGAAGETPSQQFRNLEQFRELQHALSQLPSEYQDVIRYRYQDRLSFDQIAQRMQRSAAAARKLWSRAVQRLRSELISQSSQSRAR